MCHGDVTGTYNFSLSARRPQEIGSTNCQLQEPLYGQKFDLRPLMSDLGHSVMTPSSDLITFNVCGKMKRLCANQTDVKACMKKPNGREIVMGYEENLFLTDGRIHFNFTGERCNANQNYTINLILNCDYDTHEMPFNVFPYVSKEFCVIVPAYRKSFRNISLVNS
jgi:hypothetical protein